MYASLTTTPRYRQAYPLTPLSYYHIVSYAQVAAPQATLSPVPSQSRNPSAPSGQLCSRRQPVPDPSRWTSTEPGSFQECLDNLARYELSLKVTKDTAAPGTRPRHQQYTYDNGINLASTDTPHPALNRDQNGYSRPQQPDGHFTSTFSRPSHSYDAEDVSTRSYRSRSHYTNFPATTFLSSSAAFQASMAPPASEVGGASPKTFKLSPEAAPFEPRSRIDISFQSGSDWSPAQHSVEDSFDINSPSPSPRHLLDNMPNQEAMYPKPCHFLGDAPVLESPSASLLGVHNRTVLDSPTPEPRHRTNVVSPSVLQASNPFTVPVEHSSSEHQIDLGVPLDSHFTEHVRSPVNRPSAPPPPSPELQLCAHQIPLICARCDPNLYHAGYLPPVNKATEAQWARLPSFSRDASSVVANSPIRSPPAEYDACMHVVEGFRQDVILDYERRPFPTLCSPTQTWGGDEVHPHSCFSRL